MLDDTAFLFEFIDDMPIGIACADSTENLPNNYNKFFLDMFGWKLEDVDTLDKWFKTAYPDDEYRAKVTDEWTQLVEETEKKKLAFSSVMEVNVSCKDGSIKTCELRYYRKQHFIYGVFVDVTEGKRAQREFKRLSMMDALTQINNRKSFNKRIEELLSIHKRYKTLFSILMYDIDDFKMINDEYGHSVGDDVLVEMSNLVKSHIRESDYIFRVGGEEFVILLTEMPVDEAKLVAEKIRKSVEYELNTIKDKKITISIGLSEVKEKDTKDSIYKRVDELMYESKHHGKNKITVD